MTLPLWDAERDETLVCCQLRDETHDVRTFSFMADPARWFAFRPGQFLTLELEIDGVAVARCYTIASSPARPHLLSITVKRQPGGVVSPWLHATLRPGMRIRALGPMGDFTCADHPAERYLFLSGGSGITPLMSMTRWHDDMASTADITFIHSARSPSDIIFRRELALLAQHRPGFRAHVICESAAPGDAWGGLRGRLTPPLLAGLVPDLAGRTVFTCGPAPYMQAVREMLAAAGHDPARTHEESFSFASEQPAAPTVAEGGFRISFAKSGRQILCGGDTTILAAAQAAGLRLPSSCTQGMCGTCKSKLLSGAVDMRHGGGIRQRELDQGSILLCCSRPLGDLVIDR
jgi:ferredoxin-NADP reductase